MATVAILGCGYGGSAVAISLAKRSNHQIVLIDQNPFHFLQISLHHCLAYDVAPASVIVPIDRFAKRLGSRVRFVRARATTLDEENRILHTASGEAIAFDALIIASGATTYFPDSVKQLREYAHDIKDFRGALRIRQAFESLLLVRGEGHIVVGGAGLSGVEIAAEMASRIRAFGASKIQVTLVGRKPTILPAMDEYLINEATARLTALGVKIICGEAIKEVSADSVVLEKMGSLACDLFVFAGGTVAQNIVSHERIAVEQTLQTREGSPIFAIGDVAILFDANGKQLPADGQTATQSGEHAAKNAIALLANRPLTPFRGSNKGVMVALGRHNAAGLILNRFKVRGAIGGAIKDAILWLHKRAIAGF
ncbi:NADH dehydrogenase [Campylobacterota bacterium]|nr:NADH dehydrogenase [Campylobacterota bacterium]